MTTAYAPDLAPDLEPKVVHWQPTHPAGSVRPHLLSPDGVALVLVALGALTLGAVAVGALLADRSHGRRGRFDRLGMGGLDIARLRRRPF